MIELLVYKTEDGNIFRNKDEAILHEVKTTCVELLTNNTQIHAGDAWDAMLIILKNKDVFKRLIGG